jgi:hypothetical protein
MTAEDLSRLALDRMERNERSFRAAFFGAVLLEGALLAAFLALADFRDRMQLLLLIATVGSYTILALGLVALGAHSTRNTLRVLQALELSRGASPGAR